MPISAVVAMAENRVIGCNNQLPWRLPADLRHFKLVTMGKPVIMGRKTYESIGRPLPGRVNIVVTRDSQRQVPGCIVVTSPQAALQVAEQAELCVIGGSELYRQLLPQVQRIYLTIVHHSFSGDAYFPELNAADWHETERMDYQADAENPYAYSFIVLERR
ncbi:MAG: dihydrofolate reductase [Gammaproteobacteria bacterium RIFCSPHIGHO2_12_FULL_45_9]|nr:MAG: dihydrofolate reductase [Gammaproteobacteria bacterium RIFCSPHIGHO2_12_FULL_45_9]